MDSKKMKNIKPTYAVKLGKGVFAGAVTTWQCMKCGTQCRWPNAGAPHPTTSGRCQESSTGNHVWQQIA